jgi:hypothetical protein
MGILNLKHKPENSSRISTFHQAVLGIVESGMTKVLFLVLLQGNGGSLER